MLPSIKINPENLRIAHQWRTQMPNIKILKELSQREKLVIYNVNTYFLQIYF